ncbi:MAG: prepilin-type N-terminal cleavage/methylation domain-containing protein [Candidatus Eisenbacteria bacterium]
MKLSGQRGFTLIELMITIMIVGLLATVGMPMLTSSFERAKSSEARAALGSIRRAMRMHYVEHGTYKDPQFTSGRKATFGGILTLSDVDLEGRYFSSECYTFDRMKRRTFRIKCDGAASTAPAASEVADVTLFINQRGDVWVGVGSDDGTALRLAVPLPGRG